VSYGSGRERRGRIECGMGEDLWTTRSGGAGWAGLFAGLDLGQAGKGKSSVVLRRTKRCGIGARNHLRCRK
jgi:hypothetical protein